MNLRRLALLIATVTALTAAAAAGPVNYNFAGVLNNGAPVTGAFTLNGMTMTTFSFDFTDASLVSGDCCNTRMQPIDNNGGFVIDNADASFSCNGDCPPNLQYTMLAYPGSGVGPNTGSTTTTSTFNLILVAGTSGQFSFDTSLSNFLQAPYGAGVANFEDFFRSGTVSLAPPSPSPAPEPATLWLLLSGLGCLGLAARRRLGATA